MYVVGATVYNNHIVTNNDFIKECSSAFDNNNSSDDDLGLLYQCSYEAYVRKYVFEALDMQHTTFLPPKDVHQHCVPTTIPTGEPKSVEKTKRLLHGENLTHKIPPFPIMDCGILIARIELDAIPNL